MHTHAARASPCPRQPQDGKPLDLDGATGVTAHVVAGLAMALGGALRRHLPQRVPQGSALDKAAVASFAARMFSPLGGAHAVVCQSPGACESPVT